MIVRTDAQQSENSNTLAGIIIHLAAQAESIHMIVRTDAHQSGYSKHSNSHLRRPMRSSAQRRRARAHYKCKECSLLCAFAQCAPPGVRFHLCPDYIEQQIKAI